MTRAMLEMDWGDSEDDFASPQPVKRQRQLVDTTVADVAELARWALAQTAEGLAPTADPTSQKGDNIHKTFSEGNQESMEWSEDPLTEPQVLGGPASPDVSVAGTGVAGRRPEVQAFPPIQLPEDVHTCGKCGLSFQTVRKITT